jgi:uncharacterized protein (TIGR00369 family)
MPFSLGLGIELEAASPQEVRALHSGYAHAVCRPLHVGRTVIVVQTDIYDDDDRRVAQVTQTQAVLGPAS